MLKVPKDAVSAKKRRRAIGDDHCDYLKRQQRPANRRRTDPVVVMSTMLESIVNEMRVLPDVQPFLFPVNAKVTITYEFISNFYRHLFIYIMFIYLSIYLFVLEVTYWSLHILKLFHCGFGFLQTVKDYYLIVKRPIDLQTIRENLRQKKYQSREEFLADVNQIVVNSVTYNGPKHALTVAAKRMLETCVQRLGEKEDRLMRLEKAINPLLDDDDQVALTFILDNVVNNKLKTVPQLWPFVKPVNKKLVKDYYNVIKRPMDLETISKKVTAHKYHSRHDFMRDVEQILENCIAYNGKESQFTHKAELLVEISKTTLDEVRRDFVIEKILFFILRLKKINSV